MAITKVLILLSVVFLSHILMATRAEELEEGETSSYRLHSVFAHDAILDVTFHYILPINSDVSLIGPYHLHNPARTSRDQSEWATNSSVPDVTSARNLNLFATMSYDAYYAPNDNIHWIPLGAWEADNRSYSFGWNTAYLRGYLFTNAHNQAILAFKGTDIMRQSMSISIGR